MTDEQSLKRRNRVLALALGALAVALYVLFAVRWSR